jgi:tRNA(Arg) A34 adenosine deaminase TadA
MMSRDEKLMLEAIRLSELAVEHGNEPFGAVLVKDGAIVYSNENQIYTGFDPTFHAEAGLLRRFCAKTHITDLHEYTLYSSCEPCFMCCGAMVWTKLGHLVYGASDIDLCSILDEDGAECCKIVFENSGWKPRVTAGVLRDKSMDILTRYFIKHSKG